MLCRALWIILFCFHFGLNETRSITTKIHTRLIKAVADLDLQKGGRCLIFCPPIFTTTCTKTRRVIRKEVRETSCLALLLAVCFVKKSYEMIFHLFGGRWTPTEMKHSALYIRKLVCSLASDTIASSKKKKRGKRKRESSIASSRRAFFLFFRALFSALRPD